MILRLLLILACSVTVIKVHASVSPEDSITWNKKLEDVVVVAHRPVVKFKMDKVEYRVDNDTERNTKTPNEIIFPRCKLVEQRIVMM